MPAASRDGMEGPAALHITSSRPSRSTAFMPPDGMSSVRTAGTSGRVSTSPMVAPYLKALAPVHGVSSRCFDPGRSAFSFGRLSRRPDQCGHVIRGRCPPVENEQLRRRARARVSTTADAVAGTSSQHDLTKMITHPRNSFFLCCSRHNGRHGSSPLPKRGPRRRSHRRRHGRSVTLSGTPAGRR